MARKKLRRLVVDGERYLWRFEPRYARTPAGGVSGAEDHLVVYREGCRTSALRIRFRTWEDPIIGGPLRVGAPLDDAPDAPRINLHTPGDVSALIRRALRKGWTPSKSSSPLTIDDGVTFAEFTGRNPSGRSG